MALLSDGAESPGVDQGLAFGVVNLGWALGHTVGATAGPGLAELTERRRHLRAAGRHLSDRISTLMGATRLPEPAT